MKQNKPYSDFLDKHLINVETDNTQDKIREAHKNMAKDNTQDKQVSSHTPGEQLWEVHRQRKTGIRNVGYAVLMPLITKEGEYNGQIGGYHVIIHQDMNISKEDAQGICDIHNKALEAKADNEKLKADKAVLLDALKRARDWFYANAKGKKIYADGVRPSCIPYIETAINNC